MQAERLSDGVRNQVVMVWEFECPRDGCAYSTQGNDEDSVVEDAQQHVGDKHGNTPTRDEIEPYVIGPG